MLCKGPITAALGVCLEIVSVVRNYATILVGDIIDMVYLWLSGVLGFVYTDEVDARVLLSYFASVAHASSSSVW
jgi:hypothetical protein